MSIASQFRKPSSFIKAKEFETPQTVKLLAMDKIRASNPKYGDEEGNTIRYTFEVDGISRTLETKSSRLVTAIDEAGLEAGDTAIISRSGAMMDTTWSVSKLGSETPSQTSVPTAPDYGF